MRLIYGICVCAHSDDLLRPMYCWPRRWQYTVCVCVCVEYRAYVHAFDIRYYVYVRIPVPGPAQCTAGRGGGNIRDIVLYILILKHPIHTNSICTVHYLYSSPNILLYTHTASILLLLSKPTFACTPSICTIHYLYFYPNILVYTHLTQLSKCTKLNVPLYTTCTFIY